MKKALTYTVIAGSSVCVNQCPICISEMTPRYGIDTKEPYVDWDTFRKATRIAVNHGAESVLITSKGESTLYPFQVTKYLHELEDQPFDRRELQTEGSNLATGGRLYDEFLRVWKDLGLDLVSVSIYHYNSDRNSEAFRPKRKREYILPKFIEKLQKYGLRTRLSCVMLKDYIDSVEEVEKLVEFAKENDVFQLTLRRADRPANPGNKAVAEFVDKNRLSDESFGRIADYLDSRGTLCDLLPHGANIYEIGGQNVCITTGLTHDAGEKEIRQLIYFPPNVLTTSWENVNGGRLL